MNIRVSQGKKILYLTILILTTVNFTFTGCRLLKRDKQAVAEKKTEEAEKKADTEYEKARQQHYDHQAKNTKKMMKQTEKQASKYNKPKQRKRTSKSTCR
jgi:type VI protein secretion system component VasK